MKRLLLIPLLLFFCSVASAQVTTKEVVRVTTDITGASTCVAGRIYYNATSLVNWERNNAGVCAAITSGGTPGTVTTSGSPASPQLAKFSSATAITTATATDVSTPQFCADAGANDTYTCSLAPAIASYVVGTKLRFFANTVNTGAASINFNSLGALTIVKVAGGITTALANSDIRAGQWVDGVIATGSNFQMQSTLGNGSAAILGGASLAATWTVGQFLNFNPATSTSATESQRQMIIPFACTCRNFYGRWSDTGGTVLTLRNNGVNTALVLTGNSGGTPTTYSDTTNSAAFAAGDLISIGITVATQTTSGVGVSLECDKL